VQASPWNVAATFEHAKHAIDPRSHRPTACTACHTQIAAAKDMSSVALPRMADCDGCHDGKLAFKTTGFGCVRCHGAKPPAALRVLMPRSGGAARLHAGTPSGGSPRAAQRGGLGFERAAFYGRVVDPRAAATRSAAARAGLRREIDSQAGWIKRRSAVEMAPPVIAIRWLTDERRAQPRVRKRACPRSHQRRSGQRAQVVSWQRRTQTRARKRACGRSPEDPSGAPGLAWRPGGVP
jgi:c(7)-type cytochrome triheme protein